MYIPYGHQTIDEEDIQKVSEVLRGDFITTGPVVEKFEKEVAAYTDAKYAVAVSNGTAALHIACLAAGIQEGDEVITTPITFAASANCALYCGATPVFADINPKTYNIDPADIERKITSKTKAIIPVHFAGQPCDMDAIHEIARKHNLLVIEDAAHALGAEYKGRKIGGLSDMTTFSFHPVKPITTGEGGMVVTNDEGLYERLKLFRNHGITREEKLLQPYDESEGGWYYQQLKLGFNYRLTDIQAALGCNQLTKLDGFLEKRAAIAAKYDEFFAENENIETPQLMEDIKSGWHLYPIQVPGERRKEIFTRLREAGIGVQVHYIPVYKHPYYQENGYKEVCCPNAEALYQGLISLPIYPGLTEEQQEYVIKKLLEIVGI